MRLKIVLALAGLAAPACAQDRLVEAVWVIQPEAVPEGEHAAAGGDLVLKQRLVPMGVAELQSDLQVPSADISLTKGTQLAEVHSATAKVFCEAHIRENVLWRNLQLCLIDTDNDKTFDAYFRIPSATKGLMTFRARLPRNPKPLPQIAYNRISPFALNEAYFVAIERRNFFNLYGKETFTIAFGREGSVDRISSPVVINSTEMPKEVSILGARFTALSETEGKMTIRVDATMPLQPFVIQTTTEVRIY